MDQVQNDAICCCDLVKNYGSKEKQVKAIRNLSMQVASGTFASIIGKSGSGKSTLLYLLSGLLMPDQGKVWLLGKELGGMSPAEMERFRRRKIGFVFQNYQLLPELTVYENIILPKILDGTPVDEAWAEEIMETLGLRTLCSRYPQQLSGGQQQLAAIGRAFIHRPEIIFADEPTGNLDSRTGEEVLDLLLTVRRLYGPTILLVTHNLDLARSADKLFHLEDGCLLPLEESRNNE